MSDDKNAKYEASLATKASTLRRVCFYAFFATILWDAYTSQADVLNHLTLWSFILHTIYFELHLPSSTSLVRYFHGPSLCGSFALFNMYIWTLIANPQMEFELAPEGRTSLVIYTRGFWLHLGPVICHWFDFHENQLVLKEAYSKYKDSRMFQFWTCLGYFSLGLTWEQFNGDPSGTYNVTIVSNETFVLVSKAIGVVSCIVAYTFMVKPKLISV